ncbi:PQQ-binding-like beta-propeller repeat protein [Phragmitibacter flavus]|nr:PQQ-binding-like beta-propeller repeat protein [Phragmitibacter flavus]
MHTHSFGITLIGLVIATSATTSPASDWPQWRGTNYDGISPATLLPDNATHPSLKQRWKASIGTGFSSFSVHDGKLYTMGNQNDQDTVWCFDADSGKILWQHTYSCPLDPLYYEGGPGATPTVHDDVVYTLSKKGHVHALNQQTGQVLWKRDLLADHQLELPEWSFAASPFIHKNLLILNVGDHGLALRLDTGVTEWTSPSTPSGYATPVPIAPNALAVFRAKFISAVNPLTGQKLWEIPWESSRGVNAADPLHHDGQLLVSSSSGTALLQLSPSPTEIWKGKYRSYFNPPVKIGDHVYGIDGTTHRPTRLVCFEWATGKEIWAEPGFGSGGLVAVGNHLVICDKGEIIIATATPDGFEPLIRETVLQGKCWTAPVVAHGRIYARNATGDLVCLDLEP